MKNSSIERATNASQAEKTINIQKIYLKSFTHSSPQSPHVFGTTIHPKTRYDLNVEASAVGHLHEVVLSLTVSVESDSDDILMLIEAEQAGLFSLKGFDEAEQDRVLGIFCPAQLFPYLRQSVSDMAVKGGFPPLLIDPINFEALYLQRQ